jgi:transcriptional regulator GlxA family with amidase domain
MAEQKKATVRDIVNYEPEQYLSEEEVGLIRGAFKNNEKLIKVIRKIMLPTALDANLPIEELAADAWMSDRDFGGMPNEEIKSIVLARQDAIRMVFGGLIKLKVIANQKEESPEEAELRRQKDSAK